MSGHVFHPGHHALHGITVVLDTRDGETYVGRFDVEDDGGVHLLDVAVHHSGGTGPTRDDFLRRTLKFGVRVEQKHAIVPGTHILAIRPLAELSI